MGKTEKEKQVQNELERGWFLFSITVIWVAGLSEVTLHQDNYDCVNELVKNINEDCE